MSKLMDPAMRDLGWKGGLHGDLLKATLGFVCIVGWARQCAPLAYAPID